MSNWPYKGSLFENEKDTQSLKSSDPPSTQVYQQNEGAKEKRVKSKSESRMVIIAVVTGWMAVHRPW